MAKSHKTCMEQTEIIDTFGTYQWGWMVLAGLEPLAMAAGGGWGGADGVTVAISSGKWERMEGNSPGRTMEGSVSAGVAGAVGIAAKKAVAMARGRGRIQRRG